MSNHRSPLHGRRRAAAWLASACTGALALALGLAGPAALAQGAQDYPNRPITLTMPYAPGGPGDTITRLFAGALQKTLGQQVVVDNPAGASGTIGTAKVARSRPDGYTLLMIHVSHATNLAMFKNLPYHPVDDFEPIGSATSGPMVVVARNGFPANNLNEFVAYLRSLAVKQPLSEDSPEARLREFQAIFGDPAAVEQQVIKAAARLATGLR